MGNNIAVSPTTIYVCCGTAVYFCCGANPATLLVRRDVMTSRYTHRRDTLALPRGFAASRLHFRNHGYPHRACRISAALQTHPRSKAFLDGKLPIYPHLKWECGPRPNRSRLRRAPPYLMEIVLVLACWPVPLRRLSIARKQGGSMSALKRSAFKRIWCDAWRPLSGDS